MNEKLVQLFPKTNFYRTPVHLHVLPFLKVTLISANVFFNAFLVEEQQMWNSVYFCDLMNDGRISALLHFNIPLPIEGCKISVPTKLPRSYGQKL